MTDSTPLIELNGVGKVFYTEDLETHALSDVQLDIERGEFLSIAGPSGCGKSTLLSVIGLLDDATAGEYRLEGDPVHGLSVVERARIRNQAIGFAPAYDPRIVIAAVVEHGHPDGAPSLAVPLAAGIVDRHLEALGLPPEETPGVRPAEAFRVQAGG